MTEMARAPWEPGSLRDRVDTAATIRLYAKLDREDAARGRVGCCDLVCRCPDADAHQRLVESTVLLADRKDRFAASLEAEIDQEIERRHGRSDG